MDDAAPTRPEALALNRRQFLGAASLATGATLLGTRAAAEAAASPDAPSDAWFRQPLRILQTVLRESDARDYDAAAVVRYMHEAACNVLVVNAGGIVDFFPHPLPAANPGPFLHGRDLLAEITEACRAAGFRVLARVDFRGVEEHVFRQHPDWFSVDEDGAPLRLDYTRPPLHAACYTSPYRNEHAEQFIAYLFSHYALDGIWHNSVGVGGVCHCARCARSFAAAAGGAALPRRGAAPAELERYMRWKTQAAEAHLGRMRRAVRAQGADKVYTAEVFSMYESGGPVDSGIDLYHARDYFDFLVSVAFLTENSAQIHYEDLAYAGTLVRFLKALAPEREAVILYGGNGTAHRYVREPWLDLQVWLWEAVAAGGRFWNCNFTGMHPAATHDRRNAFHGVPAYAFVRDHERLLAHHEPVGTVGIYYSRATRLSYRVPSLAGDTFASALQGMVQVLVEHHIPHRFLPDDAVSAEALAAFAVVLLPNVRCLGAREVSLLRDYVRQGGRLVVTHATGLYDETGRRQPNLQLADVQGCDLDGEPLDTRRDSYQLIHTPTHPLVAADAPETELLLNAGYTLPLRARPEATVVTWLVPRVHNQPPEKAWLPEWPRTHATIIDHGHGRGRVLTFANQPDRICHDFGHPDAQVLLARAMRWLAGPLPLETSAPPSVHVGLTRAHGTGTRYLLSFVNTTAAPHRPLRQLVPVGRFVTTLRLPGRLRTHQVLRQQGPIGVRALADERIEVEVTRLDDFAAVHLELA
jgi:hypothetical protein